MTVLYFDCFAGASGDMLLAALLDAGAPLAAILEELGRLPVGGFELKAGRVQKRGISAMDLRVEVDEKTQPHRHFSDIEKMLIGSGLSAKVRDLSLAIFARLAEAEGKIHGKPASAVHFHEVGAVDSIVDIVGIASALNCLGASEILASPLHVGSGSVRCAHGLLPVPAPATAELLKGIPVYSDGTEGELVTPTGAAVLAEIARFGPLPAMTVQKVGYGAGKKDLPFANVVRVMLGERASRQELPREDVLMFEANIDDLNPEIYAYVMERLFSAGALDVYLTPVQMKKNRPATLLSVLARPHAEKQVLRVLFRETTTLGVRRLQAEKIMLERRHVEVETLYGKARVKVALWQGEELNAVPEHEDCLSLAKASGVPLKEIYQAVSEAYRTGIRRT